MPHSKIQQTLLFLSPNHKPMYNPIQSMCALNIEEMSVLLQRVLFLLALFSVLLIDKKIPIPKHKVSWYEYKIKNANKTEQKDKQTEYL